MRPLFLTFLIGVSAVFTFAQGGPLNGSLLALLLALLFQLALPGYLLARWFGKTAVSNPVLRFAWGLVCGLGLTIVLGGVCRLLNLPVAVYLALLHGLMLLLAWTARPAPPQIPWRWQWRKLPLYALLLICCAAVMGVSYSNRYRFYGFEDQVIFVGNVQWLANNPGEQPLGLPLRQRQIARIPRETDTRHDTDGWTYTQAAWVWSSGYDPAQLIWFDLDPMLLWTVPLVNFALAYTLTRRERAAAWAAAGLVLAGLLALDNIVHYPTYSTFGRFAVFQINTLRQMSITLMLPLALMVAFSYVRSRRKRDLILLLLTGLALAMLHPIPLMIFALALGGTVALHWLIRPRWRRLRPLLWLIPVLAIMLALPFVQRLNRVGTGAADTVIQDTIVEAVESPTTLPGLIVLPDMPLLGDTFIRDPQQVFYHPVIVLAALLGLLAILWLRRSLAARYVFGATALMLLVFFLPGLTELYNKFASSVGLFTTAFLLPVGLILGLTLDTLLRRIGRGAVMAWAGSLGFVALFVLLLFEPIPIPLSARDQMNDYNAAQEMRHWHPAHDVVQASMVAQIPPQPLSVIMAPPDTVNIAIEALPHSLIVGGRGSGNPARGGDNRFYGIEGPDEPWLDSADLDFMAEYGTTHLLLRVTQPRAAQLLLQGDDFALLDRPAGHVLLAHGESEADALSVLYAAMNALYAEIALPRWGLDEGFVLVRPGDSEGWRDIVLQWESLLRLDAENDRARLGLAFSVMMAGDDPAALIQWRALHESYPDIPLFADALAYTLHALDQPEAGYAVLLAALDSQTPESRVLAARSLLTEQFFYLLDDATLDRVLAIASDDAITWRYLVEFNQPDTIRRQAALLMSRSRWQTAQDWLSRLPEMTVSPRDVTALAVMDLVQGEVDAALDRLRPALDPDWRAAKAFWQPDRWETNHAARMYYLLLGDVTVQEGRAEDAVSLYQKAIDAGAELPGRYMQALALRSAGQEELAQTILNEIVNDTLPQDIRFVPLLTMADEQAMYVMQPVVTQNESRNLLSGAATFGGFQPHVGYGIRFWRGEIISPDGTVIYAAGDAPAVLYDQSLLRSGLVFDLPADLDPLTPALVVITPAHNNAVTFPPAIVPVTLNRPDSVEIPATATQVDLRFGDSITLEAYEVQTSDDEVTISLYWRTDTPLGEDYQVLVHVLDDSGDTILQADSGPVDSRYPTSQWRRDTTIRDTHVLPEGALFDGGEIRIGLYRLSDGLRLPVSPAGESVADDSLRITTP